MSRPFSNQVSEFLDWMKRVLWCRILCHGRHRGMWLWNCLDVKRLLWSHSWQSHLKAALFCIHSSAHSSGVKISCHFANSELQRCFFNVFFLLLLLPIGINWAALIPAFRDAGWPVDSWATSLFVGLHWDLTEGGIQRQSSDSGIWSRYNEHCQGSRRSQVPTKST